jgi:hypothetical protein
MLSETSGISHSLTQRHVPEERRSQLQRCASLKSHMFCLRSPLIVTFCEIKKSVFIRPRSALRVAVDYRNKMPLFSHTPPEPAGLCIGGDTLCLVRQTPNLYSLWCRISGWNWFALKGYRSRRWIWWPAAHVPCYINEVIGVSVD